jgi:amino acid adenylation domain-containing protein
VRLEELLRRAAARTPGALSLIEPDGKMSYRELDALSNRFAHLWRAVGVRHGDRVGIWLEKSGLAIAAMQGALRCGAAYVPLDPLGPARRMAVVARNCGMRAVVTSRRTSPELRAAGVEGLRILEADSVDDLEVASCSGASVSLPQGDDNDLAYILYTSGSTGTPKGVCLSHRNALAFVDWATATLGLSASDRLVSHAPFHFDLSVLDLYGAFSAGAAVVLIPDAESFLAPRLVEKIRVERPTLWYSVPSALTLMMEQGGLLEVHPFPLRAIVFAGEPFPIRPLRRLRQRFPSVRLLNFYGPTETNVCTWYEVHDDLAAHTQPLPIGRACSGDRVWAVKDDGTTAGIGDEGLLMVSGPTVMLGYWGDTAQGEEPFATGDIVRVEADGDYRFLGRRDQMVKVRGYRVELEEIEAALLEHPALREVAVVGIGAGLQARLLAVLVCDGKKPTLLELKALCAARLPRYMIIDGIRLADSLPRTRNGKVDRLALSRQLEEEEHGAHQE